MGSNLRRNLGGSDAPTVHAIGFGAMELSIVGRPSEDEAIRTIHAALDAGMTLMDTANVYGLDDSDIGHNERIIGKALNAYAYDTSGVTVATKGGCTRPKGQWERDGRPEMLKVACEKSLEALGVEAIELYQLHAPDTKVSFEESVGALEQLRQAGKIQFIALSNVTLDEVKNAQAITLITTVQNRYSPFFWERDSERGVLEHCAKERIGYLAYSPVGGERLSKNLAAQVAVASVAKRHGVSAHVVILAWLLTKSPVVIPIPGTKSADHAKDNASAAGLTLTVEDIKILEGAVFSNA